MAMADSRIVTRKLKYLRNVDELKLNLITQHSIAVLRP